MKQNHDTKRIAKNTLLLYIRMALLMFIGLYTSRVILQALGINDFGTYNVVGGFVAMFSIISGSLVNAISRFIQVELGKGDFERLKSVFSTSVTIQIMMACVIFVLAEIIGYWFLNYKMNIDISRINAATICLHASIVTMMISLISVPYTASIISHEKMSIFASISFIEAILKLSVTYSLFISPYDKLKTYAILLIVVQIIVQGLYMFYCVTHYKECHYNSSLNKNLFREMSSFCGWNFIGNGLVVINNQGLNLLLNVYFGVAINAARGIAFQVNNAIQQFVTNFMQATLPQITKSYASGDKEYAFSLTCMSSKFSFFLMFIVSLPVLLETEEILRIWLKTPPPESTVVFIQWTVGASLVNTLGNTLFYLQMAHGDIKKYTLVTSSFSCLLFPLSWIMFNIGLPATSCFILTFILYFFNIFLRLYIVSPSTGLPLKKYVVDVVCRCLIVTLLSSILPVLLRNSIDSGILRLVIVCMISFLTTLISIYIIGMASQERLIVRTYIKKYMNKIIHFN